ncbi:MAG: GMC family oxidoreductase N-terminal domain-containing protein [Saprospiraceae bacterium]|nr:GMC family oxidoreductase N-terminal domain-containing protein [Saprospiraceae bacterium]
MKSIGAERGKRFSNPDKDFQHDEMKMYAKLYKMCGLQSTKDNDVNIAQGQCVGGSTVINNAIWLRANLKEVLPVWAKAGAHIPEQELIDNYEFIEKKLNVSPILPHETNKTAEIFLTACKKMNIPAEYLSHNRKECLGCGWCNYGCRYNRKTSMLITFIPWAEAKGAHIADQVQHVVITKKDGIANGVSFIRDNKPYLVRADKVVVCAGAIGSTDVLLQSGINPNGQAGKGFHLLGGIFVNAEYPEPLDSYDGIGLNCIAHASKEYLIETFILLQEYFRSQ